MHRPPPDNHSYTSRVQVVLDFIQSHLDRELSLEELAERARFSPYHFHRLFKGLVGESLMAYVRRLRLERAAYQLRYSERALIDVAFDCGYEAQESFTRAFKGAFGEPPARYRREHRPLPVLPAPAGVHYDPELGASTFAPLVNERGSDMQVSIEQQPALRGVRIRHVGPYDQVGECFERLAEWVGERGLFGPGTMVFGLSHDDPAITAPERLRYDACVALSEDVALEGIALEGDALAGAALLEKIEHVEVAAGEFACWLHEGPYQQLGSVYERIVAGWLPHSARELLHAPALELYLNDPQLAEPEDLQTLICLPLAPRSQGEIR